MLEELKNLGNETIKVRMISRYKGRGRPRHSDFVECKRKERQDVLCADLLACGWETHYCSV